jgi:hypothetical protein
MQKEYSPSHQNVGTTHKWPCITVSLPDDKDEFTIGLHDGFNFLLGLV